MSSSPTIPPVSLRDRRLILLMAMLTNFSANVGLMGLNVGLPDLGHELQLSASLLGWINLSLFIAMAVMAAPGAKLADIWGRRRTTIISCVVCFGGLTFGAVAWDHISLLTSRVITGFGMAVAFTNVISMVTSVYPVEQRGRVLGYSVAAVYMGLSVGPVVCGYLVELFGWRSIFWSSALFLIPSLITILMVKVEQSPAKGQRLDLVGSLFWGLGIALLFTGLTELTTYPILASTLLGVGVCFSYLYVRRSLSQANPILDVRLFVINRRFAFSSLAAFICYSASTGITMVMSLSLQYSHGLQPVAAGLVLMAQPVCQTLLTPIAGRLSDRLDPGRMASIGMAVLSLGLAFIAIELRADSSLALIVFMLLTLGVGFAIFAAPNSNAIIGSVEPSQVGQAAGTITATRLCGQIASISITTLIFSLVIGPGPITPAKYPIFQDAATICFAFFAPICFLGILASLARGKK